MHPPTTPDDPRATTAMTASGPVPGYLATPEGAGPWPGVVVMHELFGLNDDIRAIADRFASAGYVVFAPDLLAMGSRVACIVSITRSLSQGSGRTIEAILAARAWLGSRPDCTDRVGIAGFCLGGGFAILLANRGFEASSVAYGRLPSDLPAALEGACPMVASYGGLDGSLTGVAARLEAGLTEAGVRHDVKEYPDAGHSFINDSVSTLPAPVRRLTGAMHSGHVPLAAADAWERILAMFDSALRDPATGA